MFDVIPSASNTLAFAGGIVAARLTVASLGVVVVGTLGAETAIDFVVVRAAGSFLAHAGDEFATFMGNTGVTSEEAARRNLAGLGG